MADYIPSDDAGFFTWANNFSTQLTAQGLALGITAEEQGQFSDDIADAQAKYNDHLQAQTTARSKTALKNDYVEGVKRASRGIVKRLQAHPLITDSKRQQFGINVPDTTPTAVTAPTSRPVVMVESNGSLSHKVKFTDELTPLSNAKPNGAVGAEIYQKIGGDAPVSINDCKFLGVASKSPYEVAFDSADIGKQAHYLARWVTRTGLVSPVSQLTSWTIAG